MLEQLLHWANDFENFCFVNGNHIDDIPYGGFENYLAVSNHTPIQTQHELRSKLSNNRWLFGHFSYELKNELHRLKSRNTERIPFPEIAFFEPEHLLKIDLQKQQYDILHSVERPEKIRTSINHTNINTLKNSLLEIEILEVISKEAYKEKFDQILQHIIEGDIYEINLCLEFFIKELHISPIDLYIILCKKYPMPFSCLYKLGNKYLISASPERFLKKAGNKIISQPMKGTNKVLPGKEENKLQQQRLKNSEKERAENMMIMDLVRNDLSITAQPGTVQVEELFEVYKMNSVNQMISTIVSEQNPEIPSLDVILKAFPMGSMTGAPKIRAMEIIDKLEESARGIYSGSVGYFDPKGNFDFNVVIRSLIYDHQRKECSIFAGGAITYDSIMEEEYKECQLKADFMFKLLKNEL